MALGFSEKRCHGRKGSHDLPGLWRHGRQTNQIRSLGTCPARDIYRYAYWLCRDPQVAEDLVQETFLRAWKSIDSLLDDKAAKAWLITILRRENARRFERKQFDLVDLDEHPQSDQEALHSEQEMENEWLRRHIARLPVEYQEPLLLQVLGALAATR